MKKSKKKVILLIGLIALIVSFPINIYISDNKVEINEYVLNPDKLPEVFKGYTILQITDLHVKTPADVELDKKFIKAAEEKLIKEGKKIDCMVMTGDLIDKEKNPIPEGTLEMLTELAEKYPVYLIDGNHDNKKTVLSQYASTGVKVLDNKSIVITKDSSKFWLTGISDPINRLDKEDLAFKSIPVDDFDLVLIHAPNKFKELVDYGADLILCGHTHAGQIRLPFLPVLYATGQGILPKYGYGFYTERRQDGGISVMYVSKGVGFTQPISFRFFNRPEITVFTLN